MKPCDLCGKEESEFTVTSKHLSHIVENIPDRLRGNSSHIHKHICTECFVKLFDNDTSKQEENA
jgi:hypothetical protein